MLAKYLFMPEPLRWDMILPNGEPLRWDMGPEFTWDGNVPRNPLLTKKARFGSDDLREFLTNPVD